MTALLSPKPNLQLIYVADLDRSVSFYTTLFNAEPIYTSPRYVAFAADESGEAQFALWSGGEQPDNNVPRYSEIGIALPSNQAVDELFAIWQSKLPLNVVTEPHDEVFGRTFVIKDPDGHFIRVGPKD